MGYPDIRINRIDGENDNLKNYDGYVSLIVNVASHCAHTNQYHVLQKLYIQNFEKKFIILGFPCNQFGEQEPADNYEIKDFCEKQFAVSFPLFEKINVNGPTEHRLYQYLKQSNPMRIEDTSIKWNFTKFLIDRDGSVLLRIQPAELPLELIGRIVEKQT